MYPLHHLRSHGHRRVAAVVAAALALSGCADRGAASGPAGDPGAGTWLAVWVAAGLAAAVTGALLTLAGKRDEGGSPITGAVLGLQAGAAAVGTVMLIGAALRTRGLVDRPPDAELAESLLRRSGIDGDRDLYGYLVALILVAGLLLTVLLALAARFALGSDVAERAIACGILAVEIGAALVGFGRLAMGHHGWPYITATVILPVLVAALVAGWPRRGGSQAVQRAA